MHPKIGIIICGFNENRQFSTVPNVYIQSVLIFPLLRQRNPSPHPPDFLRAKKFRQHFDWMILFRSTQRLFSSSVSATENAEA